MAENNDKKNGLLNWKDKKILQQLDRNARWSSSEIGRKVGLSSQIVSYRINNLETKGIIKGYYSVINIKKLGYTHYKVMFNIRHIGRDKEEEIVKKIKKIKEVAWLVSCRGEWNFIVSIMAREVESFSIVLDQLIDILGDNIIRYVLFIVIRVNMLPYRKLLGKDQDVVERSIGYRNSRCDVEITNTDRKVLMELATNSRIGKKELATRLKITVDRVRYSIDKLLKSGIIKSFKPILDIDKVGMTWHIVFIRLKPGKKERKEEIVQYLKERYSAFYIVQGVGSWNLMVEFQSYDLADFNLLYDKMLYRFDDVIDMVTTTQVLKEHISTFIPRNF